MLIFKELSNCFLFVYLMSFNFFSQMVLVKSFYSLITRILFVLFSSVLILLGCSFFLKFRRSIYLSQQILYLHRQKQTFLSTYVPRFNIACIIVTIAKTNEEYFILIIFLSLITKSSSNSNIISRS